MRETEKKKRETIARRANMTPDQVAEDKRRLDRIRKRTQPYDEDLKHASFEATGGIHHPGRIRSRKDTGRVHRIKQAIIREYIGEDKYREFLNKAWEIYTENNYEIPTDFKKGRFRRTLRKG